MGYKTTTQGIEHLKGVEGFRSLAYDDKQPNVKITSQSQIKGTLTIGFGHTANVKIGQTISLNTAKALLKNDLVEFENYVNKLVKVPINQNMFNALVSFCYNVGQGAFAGSSVLELTNQKRFSDASKAFFNWLKPISIRGRREKESALFMKDFGKIPMTLPQKKTSVLNDLVKLGLFIAFT